MTKCYFKNYNNNKKKLFNIALMGKGRGRKKNQNSQQPNSQMYSGGNRNWTSGATEDLNNYQRQNMGGVLGNQPEQPTGRSRGSWANQNSNDSGGSHDRDYERGYGHGGGNGGFYNPGDNNYGMGNRSQSAPVSNEQDVTGTVTRFFFLLFISIFRTMSVNFCRTYFI